MSEEESFVILGSSPTDSMENYSIIQKLNNQKAKDSASHQASLDQKVEDGSNGTLSPAAVISDENSTEPDSSRVLQRDGPTGSQETDIPTSVIFINSSIHNSSTSVSQQSGSSVGHLSYTNIQATRNQHSSLMGSDQNSLAASFLLGEVESDVLKASVFSQFPSLCGSQASQGDIAKLQKMFLEYVELKSTVQKNNYAMREQFEYVRNFQNEYKAFKEQAELKSKDCYEVIAKLKNEIGDLNADLNEKISIIENVMKKENEDLVKIVSEKSSVIQNMGVHLEKLEQSQLSSFEYVKLNESDKDPQHEYMRVTEHQRIVKDMKQQLSEIMAAKLELEDMKNVYIDEINCLKVNLTSAEELIKRNETEISILKSKDIEKSGVFQKFDDEKEGMKQEINLLRTQLEVYRKDFEMERNARQSLAGEKDQLISDLKMLQRRNQQFIEEIAARRMECESKKDTTAAFTSMRRSTGSSSSPSSTSSSRMAADPIRNVQEYTRSSFVCPLCQQTFKCLDTLQHHVQACLDKA